MGWSNAGWRSDQGGWYKNASASAPNLLALDGTPVQANFNSGTSAPTVALPTTTGTDDFVGLAIYYNLSGPAVSGVSGGGLTWARRGSQVSGGGNNLEFWYATTTSPLAAPTVTVTLSGGGSTFGTLVSFAFSGANTSSPFDIDASLPGTTTSNTPISVSTSNTNDVILGMFVCANSTGVVQATFSSLSAGNFVVDEYKIVSAAQPALSVGITGDTILLGIVDAVKSA